jgi:hypothetical protein
MHSTIRLNDCNGSELIEFLFQLIELLLALGRVRKQAFRQTLLRAGSRSRGTRPGPRDERPSWPGHAVFFFFSFVLQIFSFFLLFVF